MSSKTTEHNLIFLEPCEDMHAEYTTLFHKETQGLVGTEGPYAGNETIVVP